MCPVISSTSNPRIVAARKLRQKKHRIQQDRFLVEGLQLVARALEQQTTAAWVHHVVPADVYHCPSAFTSPLAEKLVEQFEEAGGQAVEVSESVLESLSSRAMNQGLIATFARSALRWSVDEIARHVQAGRPQLLLALDGIQYPGNLGTLLRTADAIGCLAVVQLGAGADSTDPLALRGSMGSAFAVPLVHTEDLAPIRAGAFAAFSLVGSDASADGTLWDAQALTGSAILCLGNEAHGLSPAVRSALNACLALPMAPGVDSLNVAVAGGVLMYEWKRRNSVGGISPRP